MKIFNFSWKSAIFNENLQFFMEIFIFSWKSAILNENLRLSHGNLQFLLKINSIFHDDLHFFMKVTVLIQNLQHFKGNLQSCLKKSLQFSLDDSPLKNIPKHLNIYSERKFHRSLWNMYTRNRYVHILCNIPTGYEWNCYQYNFSWIGNRYFFQQ